MSDRLSYQQTEVGPLPCEWNVGRIGDHVQRTDYGTSSPSRQMGAVPVLRMGNIQSGAVDWDDLQFTNEMSDIERYALAKGDLLFNRTNTPELVGKTAIFRGERPAIFAGYLVRVRTNAERLDAEFLNYFMNSRPAVEHSRKVLTIAVGQANINAQKLRDYPIPLPPLPEQRAIAAALSDVDALVESIDRVIAKKRAIKQATMQQLLTGRTRLPGFSGEWEVKRLGDVAEIVMGQSPRSASYNTRGDGLPLVQGNADVANRKTIRRVFTTEITKYGRSGDVLLSVRAPVGEVSRATFDVCLGRGVCAIRFSNDFLYHLLIFLEPTWTKHSKGSTFDSVNSNDVRGFEVTVTVDVAEQRAIAAVLSDMDAELEALQQRRHKTERLKQGMMQELLTGRTRLV
jgi:type I restriction enzyme S subunit